MKKARFHFGSVLILAFAMWTFAVKSVDVQPIGPLDTTVGFAALNGFVHKLTGVHMGLYKLTDALGLIPLGIMTAHAFTGLVQLIKRRSIMKVDSGILLLGGYYAMILTVYLLFEVYPVNYRPVLIGGMPEASYPSSTTMLVMSVMPAFMLQLKLRMRNSVIRQYVMVITAAFTVFMVAARLISGVHWASDIIGGALLSAGLFTIYSAFLRT